MWRSALIAVPLLLLVGAGLWYNGQSWQLECVSRICELSRSTLGLTTSVVSFELLGAEERRGRLHLATTTGPTSLPGGHRADVKVIRDYIERRQAQYRHSYSFARDPVFWFLIGAPLLIFGYLGARLTLGMRAPKSESVMHTVDRVSGTILDAVGITLGLTVGVVFACLGIYVLGLGLMRSGPFSVEDLVMMTLLGIVPLAGGAWFVIGTLRYVRELFSKPVQETQIKRVRRRKRSSA